MRVMMGKIQGFLGKIADFVQYGTFLLQFALFIYMGYNDIVERLWNLQLVLGKIEVKFLLT